MPLVVNTVTCNLDSFFITDTHIPLAAGSYGCCRLTDEFLPGDCPSMKVVVLPKVMSLIMDTLLLKAILYGVKSFSSLVPIQDLSEGHPKSGSDNKPS